MKNELTTHEKDTPREGENRGKTELAFNALSQLFNLARESKITERELKKYATMRDIAIAKITTDCRVKEKLIDKVFEERRRIIEKDFELIDKGMAENDYTYINMGLQNIADVIKQNPFKIFELTTASQRHRMLEGEGFSLE